MNSKAIIIITDFNKDFWKIKINKLFSHCETFTIAEDDNRQKTIKPHQERQRINVFVIENSEGNKLILTKQSSNEQENQRNVNVINQNICNNISESAIAAHINGGTLAKGDLPNYKEFHNEMEKDKIWQAIESCFNDITKNVKGNTPKTNLEAFDLLWQCLASKPSEVAHTLRSKILTPFIPFHLFHQLDNKDSLFSDWQDIFRECYVAIKNTEEKFIALKGLRKDISPDIKNCAYKKFTELKKYFRIGENGCTNNVEKNDCRKTIEDFAQCLEKIVNCIESGEESSDKK